MNSKLFFFLLPTLLACLPILEAKSLKDGHRERCNVDINSDGTEEDINSSQRAKRHHSSRRDNQVDRRRRGFASWNIPQEDYSKFSMWRPPVYSLNRPYFIPVYGPAGQIPIFFPPQQYNPNVGVPPDNPMRPFMGPAYLPPVSSTMKPATNTGMVISNRNPDLDDDDEPRPIWGNKIPGNSNRRPPNTNVGSGFIPTRPPKAKTTTTVPPLVHQVNGGKIPLAVENDIENVFGTPPSAIKTTQAPVRSTTRPSTQKEQPSGPSNCVWAVVSCCSVTTNRVVEQCFEQRGCPGPFWDRSPCDSDFAKAAINKALEYYGK